MSGDLERQVQLGPICEETGVYASRCEHCGAEPMNAAVASVIPPSSPTSEDACNQMRAELLAIEKRVRQMAFGGAEGPPVLYGEAHAQAVLAVRHLEDARMRLGKVIQYAVGGGVSCFDSGRKPADDGR